MLNTEIYRIPTTNKDNYSLLGDKHKGLLICCSTPDISDASKVFLGKILSAINYNLDSDCLLLGLLPDNEVNLATVIRDKKITDIFIFGLNPSDLGLNIQVSPYSSLSMESFRILWSHSLAQLQTDKSKKMQLWQSLQAAYLKK